MSDIPRLSAVMVAGPLRDRVERCLKALLEQTALAEMEIVIVDILPAGTSLAGAGHEAVRVLKRPQLGTFASARVEGVRQARADVIAFVEDHASPSPGWAAAVLAAFRRPVAAVNYAFANANPRTYVSRACLMAEYGQWMVPARAGPVALASCHNIAYRRTWLEALWNSLEELFEAEFLLHRRIRERWGIIWLEPDAVVAHENWESVADLCRANGAMKQLLADVRAREGHWSRLRRRAYAAGMLLSPPLHVWRLVRTLWRRPSLWPPFLCNLPVLLCLFSYCGYREALGYLFGAETSREQFLESELAAARNV